MSRGINKLSASEVKAFAGGKLGDGGGLWLYKLGDTASWVLRYTSHGRRREMGLGPAQDISLKDARIEAAKWRNVVSLGNDPIKQRERERRDQERNMHLLRDVALDAFESRKAELRGDGKAGRWFSPLELHVLPKLGGVPISDIDQIDIKATIAPIWHTKAATATKAINRLAIVLKHGAALGLNVDLQAVDKAKALLGAQRHTVKNIEAMLWADVPAFYETLAEPSLTHLALRLLILTGVRSGPLRLIRLEQIEGDVWTIPAEVVKGRKGKTKEFRVPLSSEALRVIELAKPFARDGYLFPNVNKGVISNATMSAFMRRAKLEGKPHGFRTSLRTWLTEATNAPHEVAETCLTHSVGSATVKAYQRSDFLEQRRILMERWSTHVVGDAGQVVRFG